MKISRIACDLELTCRRASCESNFVESLSHRGREERRVELNRSLDDGLALGRLLLCKKATLAASWTMDCNVRPMVNVCFLCFFLFVFVPGSV